MLHNMKILKTLPAIVAALHSATIKEAPVSAKTLFYLLCAPNSTLIITKGGTC